MNDDDNPLTLSQYIVCEQEGADWLPFQTIDNATAGGDLRKKGRPKEVVFTRPDLGVTL